MLIGQIGCGRQNPLIQSAKLASRIGMAKGMPSTSLQDWKALHCFLGNADGTTQVDSVQIGLQEAAALRPWMLVPESLVALAVEVRLTYICVSKYQQLYYNHFYIECDECNSCYINLFRVIQLIQFKIRCQNAKSIRQVCSQQIYLRKVQKTLNLFNIVPVHFLIFQALMKIVKYMKIVIFLSLFVEWKY
ncbi:Hypothetical_protein [Hexamita inflata]|uniref:Hypothetical_protein n=1 Tax=Hexamita inflata TaxID=28002 RepID=A0AA86QWU1_9EUKA|nr:Hypothetical protein HINF_LOCUS48549 [Hexamita inflata]